jgi:chemotaxis family two-component system sensor kinase Cph1
MDNETNKKIQLRKKAEELVKNQIEPTKDKSWDLDEVIYELRVHQIELEMQNDELRESQIKLEDSRHKYFDLYNFAPAGYFTLDEDGIILDVNLAGSALLGVERRNLHKRAFIQYVKLDQRNMFHHHINEVLETGTKQTVDLELLKMDDDSFYAHLETIKVHDENGNFQKFRIIVSDITDLKNTEEALKESEERYRQIFVNNHAPMLLIDPINGDIIDANPAATNFYRYTLDELVKMRISDINVSDDNLVLEEMQKAVSKEENHFIFRHRLSNGEIRDVDVYSGLINQRGKNLLYSIVHDITAQKKAEIALRNSENRYRSLFENMLEGFAFCKMIFDKNNHPVDWIYLDVNTAFDRLTGLGNIIGKKVTESIPGIKESDPKLFEVYGRVALTGKPEIFEIDFKPLNVWYNISVFSPEKEFFVAVFEDITKRKKSELALKEITHNLELKVKERTQELISANEYNRSLIEASLDPLVTIGPDGKITDVNHSTEKFTGRTRNELIGTDFSDYFTEPKKAKEGYQKVFKEGFVLDYPLEIKNKNEHTTSVLYNASVYKNEFNEVTGVFAAARDITGIKKAEKKLRKYQDTLEKKVKERTKALAQSNKELEEFAYVASHDLKEPLRMITSFLQLLERRYKDQLDQDANEFIEFAVEGAKRMDMMINDLLDYSKIGNQEREFEYLQSEKLLETVLMNLKSAIDNSNTIVTHDPLPLIFANDQMMIQLFQNLISNSIKYRGEKNPKIHISVDNVNDEYIFAVKDNGIGIDQKHLERIFTIFKRLHTREEYEGNGIGLAIVQKIVQKHHGKIWAKSEFGKGTTFYFTLPNRNY